MIKKILTAADKAQERQVPSGRQLMLSLAEERGFIWDGHFVPTAAIARIDFGRWLVDCSCRNAFYVDPEDPVFFCPFCGNSAFGGGMRPVLFPKDRTAIEQEVLNRPVAEPAGLGPCDTAINSTSLVPGLARSWTPGETVADLRDQRMAAVAAGRGA